MRCDKVRQALPLFVGGDLSAGKIRRLQAHLETCAFCRREEKDYRAALAAVKAGAAREAGPEWDAARWRALMARITAEGMDRKSYAGPFLFRRPVAAAAAGLGVMILAALILFVFKDPIFRPKDFLQVARQTAGIDPRSPDRRHPAVEPDPGILKDDPEKEATGPAGREGEVGPFPEALDVAMDAGLQDPEVRAFDAGPKAASVPQDVLSVTLVSQETGLQVVWFFHKDFDWKGDR